VTDKTLYSFIHDEDISGLFGLETFQVRNDMWRSSSREKYDDSTLARKMLINFIVEN